MNLGHKYSSKSWLCSCGDEFQKNSKLTGPASIVEYLFNDRDTLEEIHNKPFHGLLFSQTIRETNEKKSSSLALFQNHLSC